MDEEGGPPRRHQRQGEDKDAAEALHFNSCIQKLASCLVLQIC